MTEVAFNRDELIEVLADRFQIDKREIKRARLFYLKALYVLMCTALEQGETPSMEWLEHKFDKLINHDILSVMQGRDLGLISTALHSEREEENDDGVIYISKFPVSVFDGTTGEVFREQYLEPLFQDMEDMSEIVVDLDGTVEPCTDDFFKAAFGTLAKVYGWQRCLDRIVFQTSQIALEERITHIMKTALM